MTGLHPAHTALGALIAARRADLGVHVVECAPGQFDVVLQLDGPWRDRSDALRAARLARRGHRRHDARPAQHPRRAEPPRRVHPAGTAARPEGQVMTAALFDAARVLIGFCLGYTTARTADPCPVCGQPATITGLYARCAPVVHPRKEIR